MSACQGRTPLRAHAASRRRLGLLGCVLRVVGAVCLHAASFLHLPNAAHCCQALQLRCAQQREGRTRRQALTRQSDPTRRMGGWMGPEMGHKGGPYPPLVCVKMQTV